MIKRTIAVFALGLFLLFTAGCASSERMMRTSGGVLQEYSAPSKIRITSGKYTDVPHPAHSKRDQLQQLGGIHDTLINIWPFFFRNRDYISCLWPMIDADPYGFAVRPFYNQEGDDCSILFPLSAWNSARRHGWVLNTYWNNETDEDAFCGFFPLFHLSPAWNMYSPLWISKRYENRTSDPFSSGEISTDFHLVSLLGYGKVHTEWADPGPYDLRNLLWRSNKNLAPDTELAYKLARSGITGPLPAKGDKAGWDKIRQQAAATFIQRQTVSGGLFPLFGFSANDRQTDFNVLLGFPYYKSTERKTRFSILSNLLFGYTRKDAFKTGYPRVHNHAGETSLQMWGLLSGFETSRIYAEDPKTRAFERLAKRIPGNFTPEYREKIRQEIKLISPDAELPDTVVNNVTLEFFLRELQAKTNLPTESYTTGGFLPLYFQYSSRDKTFRLLPVLLTWSEKNKYHSEFFSLPFLSWGGKNENTNTTAIFFPFGYWQKQQKYTDDNAVITAPDADPEYQLLTKDKTFAACGLFRREEKTFYTARNGYDYRELEKLRQLVKIFSSDKKSLDRRRKQLETRRQKKWPQTTKIEQYTYLIEQERIRLEEEAIGKVHADLVKRAGEISRRAAKAHLQLDMTDPAAAMKTIYGACEPLTRQESGNLFFFNRVRVSNGAFRWNIFLKLATGEGNADREDTQVLQFLYRHKRRGDKSETVYFPFVAIQKDGANSRFRFLWRVFERTEENGKIRGHILFIPYGE